MPFCHLAMLCKLVPHIECKTVLSWPIHTDTHTHILISHHNFVCARMNENVSRRSNGINEMASNCRVCVCCVQHSVIDQRIETAFIKSSKLIKVLFRRFWFLVLWENNNNNHNDRRQWVRWFEFNSMRTRYSHTNARVVCLYRRFVVDLMAVGCTSAMEKQRKAARKHLNMLRT